MAIPFLSPIDLNRNELQNFRVQNLAAAPTHAPGLAYFDTVLGQLGISTGSAWVYLSVAAGLDSEAVQDIVGAMGASSSVVTATYNDAAGTMVYSIGAAQVTNAMLAGSVSADKLIDGTTNHVFTAADDTKLTGIATAATANSTDATLLARANHTGTQSADTLTSGTTNKLYVAADVTKLAGIAAGATANSSDAVLEARANHTGTQLAATISDFTASVNALIASTVGAAPAALDTLVELAAALGNDANYAATMATNLGLKANTSSLSPVATAGTYASITGKPSYNAPVGDGVATTYVITHNLNSQNVDVDLRLTLAPFTLYQVEVRNTSANTITLVFGAAPTTNLYTVIVTAV